MPSAIFHIACALSLASAAGPPPAVGLVRVAVTRENIPVEGLFVTIFSAEHHSRTARSDAHGNVVFRVPSGEWRVRVETGREELPQPVIVVRAGSDASIVVRLNPTIHCNRR
jgi:hypothetical protein